MIDPDASLWDWLAYDLRFYRKKYGMTQNAMAQILGISAPHLSNLELGIRRVTEKHAKRLDERFKTGGHFQRLLRYARRGHDPDWFKQYTAIEARAILIKTYEALAIPAVFQTPEYAHALISATGAKNVDELVNTRMERQSILTRENPATVWSIISQNAIDWPVGTPDEMRKQLAHLLELATWPSIGVRVLPRSANAHAGFDGSFYQISGQDGEVVYVDAPGGGRLVPSPAEVRSFAMQYDRIGQAALPESLSRELIQKAMEEL